MRSSKVLIGAVAAAALLVTPLSPASAQPYWHHPHRCWFVGCVLGAVVGTAAVVATAPFAIVDAAVSPPPPRPYYGPLPGYDGPGYGPPPPRPYYGPPGPPPGYGPPPDAEGPPPN